VLADCLQHAGNVARVIIKVRGQADPTQPLPHDDAGIGQAPL
jgi:hypothetical protein